MSRYAPRTLMLPGIFLGFLLVLLSACSTSPTTVAGNAFQLTGSSAISAGANNSSSTGGSTSGGPTGQKSVPQNTVRTTMPMPATDTSCPAADTARAAVMRPLALGSHQNLVYVYNEVPHNTTIAFGHLRRYDTTTEAKADIVTSGVRIDQAQVSTDGQWVLFLSIPNARGDRQHSAMLQLVRMDGQGLQTLYCFPTVTYTGPDTMTRLPISIQWSTDQKSILVSVETNNTTSQIFVIDTATGSIRQLFLDQNDTTYAYSVVTWLDNTRFYVLKTHLPTTSKPQSQIVYLMDASKATVNNPGLQQVLVSDPSLTAFSIDSSYDGTRLFSASCLFKSGSVVAAQPATGGQAQFLLRNDLTDCIMALRAPSANTLLLLDDVFDQAWNAYSPRVVAMNPKNGAMPTLATLTPIDNGFANFHMNDSSQLPWSNVARDNSSYALQAVDAHDKTQSIVIGSLAGGDASVIATTESGLSSVSVAGWTTA